MTPLSSANPNDLLPLPVAMFHILVAVADQDRHGYAIMQDVAARTNGALKLSPGTLYGSIRRMLEEALIVELIDRQRPDEDDERRRYYRITAFGRSVAQAEAARLSTLLRQAKAVGLGAVPVRRSVRGPRWPKPRLASASIDGCCVSTRATSPTTTPDEMTHLYRDRVRGEGAASVWLALVADLARTAPREQISTLVQDVRHAWRTWRRTPVLALAAVLTLALGVGANTAVFSVVHGLLLRPLPYPGADRLVEVFEDNTRAGGVPFFRVSLLNYLSWIERAQSFDALAAFNGRDFTVTEHGDPERILGQRHYRLAVQGAPRARQSSGDR